VLVRARPEVGTHIGDRRVGQAISLTRDGIVDAGLYFDYTEIADNLSGRVARCG
jgi:hypothetical protein